MKTVAELPAICVINSYGESASGPGGIFKRMAYGAIHDYQKHKYPGSNRVDAVHTVAKLYGDIVLDVTWPKAKTHEYILQPGKPYRVYKWVGSDLVEKLTTSADPAQRDVAQKAIRAMYDVAAKFHNRGYDWFQLIGIGWQHVFSDVLRSILPPPYNKKLGELISIRTLFGLGKLRTVCSAGAHAAILAAYKVLQQYEADLRKWGFTLPSRPLGKQYVETTCPADFENHETMIEVTLSA